jgi:hypothetical protein
MPNSRIRIKGRFLKSPDEKDKEISFIWYESVRVHGVILDGGFTISGSDFSEPHLINNGLYEVEASVDHINFLSNDDTPDGKSVQALVYMKGPYAVHLLSDPTTQPAANGVKDIIAGIPKNFLPSNDKGKWRDYDFNRLQDWLRDYSAKTTIHGSGVFEGSEKGVPRLVSSDSVQRYSTIIPKTTYMIKGAWKDVQTMVIGHEYEFEGPIETIVVPPPEYLDLEDADLNIQMTITVRKPVTIREKSSISNRPPYH